MAHCQIARFEHPAAKGFFCGFGVFVIPLHNAVRAETHLAQCLAICRDRFAGFLIQNLNRFSMGKAHPLTSLDGCPLAKIQPVPFFIPGTMGKVAIGFSQPVYLRHIKAQLFNFFQNGSRWRGTGCHGMNCPVRLLDNAIRGIYQHGQNNRRAAKMGDLMFMQ